jgi:hypothetical protein
VWNPGSLFSVTRRQPTEYQFQPGRHHPISPSRPSLVVFHLVQSSASSLDTFRNLTRRSNRYVCARWRSQPGAARRQHGTWRKWRQYAHVATTDVWNACSLCSSSWSSSTTERCHVATELESNCKLFMFSFCSLCASLWYPVLRSGHALLVVLRSCDFATWSFLGFLKPGMSFSWVHVLGVSTGACLDRDLCSRVGQRDIRCITELATVMKITTKSLRDTAYSTFHRNILAISTHVPHRQQSASTV